MRAPFQVLVFPYRKSNHGFEVLICLRSDMKVWQGVSGGGESTENALEAAVRELREETSLIGQNWQKLDSMCMLPRVYYKGHEQWKEYPFVIPEYAYSVFVEGEPTLSGEHLEYKWCRELDATNLLKFDSNKVAVWELFQRLNSSRAQLK